MGSLLSGWDSEFLDPDRVRLARNKSFTREEIAAFWRSHRQNHDDDDNNNGGDEQQQQQQQQQQQHPLSPTATFIRSWRNSMDDIEEEGQSRHSPRGLEKSKTCAGPESSVGLEKSKKGDDWWIRSNWAFLNEPPRDELDESAHKYAAQFHVAELATNEHHELTGSN